MDEDQSPFVSNPLCSPLLVTEEMHSNFMAPNHGWEMATDSREMAGYDASVTHTADLSSGTESWFTLALGNRALLDQVQEMMQYEPEVFKMEN